MSLVLYIDNLGSSHLNQMLSESNLKHYASDLIKTSFDSMNDLIYSIERSIKACEAVNVSPKLHFKQIYLSVEGELQCDWKISQLGRQLIILNGNTANKYVASLQFELIQKA